MPMPKEDQAAHTISQRLRMIKRVPPELIPLGVVMGAGVIMAAYSMGRKLYVDKQLRLSRSAREH
ncbi:hypothetical protein EX30DRAFT_395089 [Ascodesmis nigricans]|uniref:NADH-ubiquinone reductase complex 1 MLRQ subunit n=1 Tax=Ascodesmis nigricans TaxID=341454 RepID=A0A4S2MZS4_9PEZI|nr:hypothetical protein EX30DRAFT_395089 [Ascodesmis nigricans]